MTDTGEVKILFYFIFIYVCIHTHIFCLQPQIVRVLALLTICHKIDGEGGSQSDCSICDKTQVE